MNDQEEMRVLSYGVFIHSFSQSFYLVEKWEFDSENDLKGRVKQSINAQGNWGGLGQFISVLSEIFIDDGNGNYRKAEERIMNKAKEMFFQRFNQVPKSISPQVEIFGRNMFCIS